MTTMTYDDCGDMSGDLTATAFVTPLQKELLEYVRRQFVLRMILAGRERELKIWTTRR